MRLVGAASICAEAIADELRESAFAGRPLVVVSDGQDVTAIFGDDGDTPQQVINQARRLIAELHE